MIYWIPWRHTTWSMVLIQQEKKMKWHFNNIFKIYFLSSAQLTFICARSCMRAHAWICEGMCVCVYVFAMCIMHECMCMCLLCCVCVCMLLFLQCVLCMSACACVCCVMCVCVCVLQCVLCMSARACVCCVMCVLCACVYMGVGVDHFTYNSSIAKKKRTHWDCSD